MIQWAKIEDLEKFTIKQQEPCTCPYCEAGIPHSIVATTVEERPRTVFLSAATSAKIREAISKMAMVKKKA